uniref:6-cysteine protein n=1 Tax=Strongyloides stercoralis TaxID=6248 RepID=A0A0K0EFT6_STRER
MWYLFFLIIYGVFADKVIWDGDEHDFEASRRIIMLTDRKEDIGSGKVDIKNSKLSKEIHILPYMVLKNIRILELDISEYKTGEAGIMINSKDGDKYYQIFGQVHRDVSFFTKYEYSTCQLFHCEPGLFFLHYEADDDFVEKKVTDFYGIFYTKFISNDMYFKLDKFELYRDMYPLIICPYTRWTSTFSGVEFVPQDKSGIVFKKFSERQILLPGYNRSYDSNFFVCGHLKYMDDTELTVGHEINYIESKINGSSFQFKKYEDTNELWTCDTNESPKDYFHFIYSKNKQSDNKMRYVEYNMLEKNYLYYDDVIYLYKKNQRVLRLLEKAGVEHGDKTIIIKPKCANTLSPRKGIVKLVNTKNSVIVSGSNETQTMYVQEDMLNVVNEFKCQIFIDGAEKNSYLSKFYDNEVEFSLVSKDTSGNKIIHNNILFKNNVNSFDKYECELNVKNSFFNYTNYIENLAFITVPTNLSITNKNEVWKGQNYILIQCPDKFSTIGVIDSMEVIISKTESYNSLQNNNEIMFYDEDNFKRFRHIDLFAKNITIEDVTTKCAYKTSNNATFSIVKNGKVLNKIITGSNNNNTNASNLTIIILISLATIIFALITSFIILTLVRTALLRIKKRKQKRNGSLGDLSASSLSSLSSSSSSLSSYSSQSKSGVSSQMNSESRSTSASNNLQKYTKRY